jgi:hypothetical protein
MYSPVNPDQPSTSTTDTLLQWKPAGGQAALTAGIVAVSVSAHAFLHVSLLASTVAAVAILRYQALLGVLYGVLIAVGGVVYVPVKGEDPSDYLTRALANITNAIAGRPLIPAAGEGSAERAYSAPEPVASVSPLPPARSAARAQDEPTYWSLIQEKVYAPGGRPDIVKPRTPGRHAKPDNPVSVIPDLQGERQFTLAGTA